MAIFDNRICRTCGVKFSGGPRAWYCPTCRAERKREQKRKYNKYGYERRIGDIDHCEECGRTYTIQSGTQRYCPDCKEKVRQRTANEQSTKWYHEQCDKEKRNELRRKRYPEIKDKINEKRRNTSEKRKKEIYAENRKWRKNNPEKVRKYWNKYKETHKEHLKSYYAEYYKRKKQKQNTPEQN